MSFRLNYAAGPFGLGATYTEKKYPGSLDGSPQIAIRNRGVGAHYVLGPAYTVADFVTIRNTLTAGTAYAAQLCANHTSVVVRHKPHVHERQCRTGK
ncbi:hypothetical protein HAV18_01230 [Burkholderia sp. D-99]|nr:hypothetical protein [Burkholderia sp. D-99]